MYSEIERKYKTIYPESDNATYITLMNFSDDLSKPFQRWFRYKEGFSVDLVKQLIREYSADENGIILDPFMGSGSTLLAASELNLKGIGFEVNPFSYNLAKLKLYNYSSESILEFEKSFKKILSESISTIDEYDMPRLSFSNKVFDEHIRQFYMTVKKLILKYDLSYEINRELLNLGWLACLENFSNYKKAGNGLKRKKYVKPRFISVENALTILEQQYITMLNDIQNNKKSNNSDLYNTSSLEMMNYLDEKSISGIIFSPPYANCFDYTEIYKLELWFGEYVHDYPDLKKLRKMSLRSHLNSDLNINDITIHGFTILNEILVQVRSKSLWDKRIPDMLELYFVDMYNILKNCYDVLKSDGFCSIIVGNSAYGGIIIPTDLILAEFASSIGFIVDKIEIDRYIITSSQQYDITKGNKKFLRESIVCLVKK